MTTNFAEDYNAVLRGARAQPLVGIIEFFLYRTMQYFLTVQMQHMQQCRTLKRCIQHG
jgi:hypothetical protein